MRKLKQQGDRLLKVTFEKGRNGSPLARVNGKISFPERGGRLPKVGETWEVELAGTNPRGTVHFLRLIRRLPTWVVDGETGAVKYLFYGKYLPKGYRFGHESLPADLRQKSEALIRQNLEALLVVVASERVGAIIRRVLEKGPDGSIWAREKDNTWALYFLEGSRLYAVTIDGDGTLWETGGSAYVGYGTGPGGWANAEEVLQKMEEYLGLPVGRAKSLWWESGVGQFLSDVKQMREEEGL